MVVAEVLTGIALVKQATDFIKSNINTISDIRDIGQQIDDLFRGEQDCQKKRSKKSMSIADQFGVESVATEVIDARLAQEKLREVAIMVDLRFGHGTWQGIVDERAKRIREAKEAARLAKIEQAKKQEEFWEMFSILAGIVVMSLVVISVVYVTVRG
jgi:hypothetical protein